MNARRQTPRPATVPFALPGHPAREAAEAVLASPQPILVCTGFPVRGHPETDGPPGAVVLADALLALGKTVKFASYSPVLAAVRQIRPEYGLVAVPVRGEPIVAGPVHNVSVITIEICGVCEDGVYRNMHGADISAQAPLFEQVVGLKSLVSIGDKGNEYGMGSAPDEFFARTGVRKPVSTTSHLVPAAVSNYGAYAIVREMEKLTGAGLLPDIEEHINLIAEFVARGFVDGHTGEQRLAVDGEDLDYTREALAAIGAKLRGSRPLSRGERAENQ
jgi:D-glutamate cyclase